MLLTELQLPQRQNKADVQAYMLGAEKGEQKAGKRNIKILGAGQEAIVFKEPNDLGVVKVMSSPDADLNQNPYVRYINVARRYAKSNPFLPRIEASSQQKISPKVWQEVKAQAGIDDNDPYYNVPAALVTYRMEELHPISDLDLEQLKAVYLKTFGEQQQVDQATDTRTILNLITQQLKALFNGELDKSNINPELINALNIVRGIRLKTNSAYDLHGRNMMVRYGPGGPQLVITDPLFKEQTGS